MSYYETPADVLEDARELVTWAKRSVAVAMRAPKPATKRKSPLVRRRRSL
jgi:TfoX/Sxy family transcriptional regulator of competence genes